MKPVLLLDVDGVLNVFPSQDSPFFTVAHEATGPDGRRYVLNVRPEASAWVAELAQQFEIVWCTTWSTANAVISPLLGLPGDLDQVALPEAWEDVPPGLCRKTEHVRMWAARRGVTELAWIDDEVGDSDRHALERDWDGVAPCRRWEHVLASTPPLRRTCLVQTDPYVGVTEAGLDLLLRWATA